MMHDTRYRAASLIASAFLCFCVLQTTPSEPLPQTSTAEGLQLLHKMQAALGGAEKIAAIRDYEETVLARTWNSNGTFTAEVRKRTRWMQSPNLLRLDQIGPRDTYILYFDGSSGSGWEILPDLNGPDPLKTTGKSIALAGGELKFAKNYLAGFQFNFWLADRIPGYTVTSPSANVLRIEHDGNATDFKLDPATWLPASTSGVSLANPDRPVPAEMRYEAWTSISGVRFPTKRTNYHNGLKAGEITDAGIRVNAGLKPEELSAKPASSAPDIPLQLVESDHAHGSLSLR